MCKDDITPTLEQTVVLVKLISNMGTCSLNHRDDDNVFVVGNNDYGQLFQSYDGTHATFKSLPLSSNNYDPPSDIKIKYVNSGKNYTFLTTQDNKYIWKGYNKGRPIS